MRIRMLSTQRGADDGFTLRVYEAGTEHELGPQPRAVDLAEAFVRAGWAVEVDLSMPLPLPAASETTLAAPVEETAPPLPALDHEAELMELEPVATTPAAEITAAPTHDEHEHHGRRRRRGGGG